MANYWTGSVENDISGSTPFGIYDTDTIYQTDGPKVASWCAKRMGYPIVDVELVDLNFYACFEEAVSEYSAQVNQFNIRNNLTSLQGQSTGSNYTGKKVAGNPLPNLIQISNSYGTYAGVGGNVDIKRGSITIDSRSQTYDLQALWGDVSESKKRIEIQRVFNYGPAALSKFYDPFAGSYDQRTLLDEMGMGNVSPSVSFILRPIHWDITRANTIETNDKVRKSNYSFELINNK